MDPREKARTKFHFHRPGVDAFNTAKIGQGKNQKPQVTHALLIVHHKVADPDPYWVRIQSGQWIRIQEGKNDPQK
jgi:hypothetical protein